jgi:hypothetical protein
MIAAALPDIKAFSKIRQRNYMQPIFLRMITNR